MAFRFSRPLLNVVQHAAHAGPSSGTALKTTTRITGLAVHPDPVPALTKTYEATLAYVRENIPSTAVYRQGVEAFTLHKLSVVQAAHGDIAAIEKALNEGQIEESIDIATDELRLAHRMVEWKAWDPLEEKPEAGQWEYAGEHHVL
ncbi:hypothetical protein FISHEDRAFT_52910 [Fistulina hepatica ATCC 64428]|nr:hypothetical protein FISHEDRAFT_52910 [Fistulina hepatica ATCC 64428]